MKSVLCVVCVLIPMLLVAATGTIIVKMDGLRSNNGQVRVFVYNSKLGFPSKPQHACAQAKVKIENNRAEAVFENLPYGNYAVGVHHDENDNNHMDCNWIHIPVEGWGASNNAKGFLGTPPSFNSAKFQLNSDSLIIPIKMRY